jgi:hypothetical protein
VDKTQIQSFLQLLGERVPPLSRLYLVGGGALVLLGSPRLTIDIDFVGDDISPSELHKTIVQIAKEQKIFMEPVAIERFIPLPDGSQERSIRIGQYGNLEVFVADPYSIALSKLDRGFDTDFDDLVFLVRQNLVQVELLEQMTQKALSQAREFDMNPTDVHAHLRELKKRII